MPIIHTGMPNGTFADSSVTAAKLAANAVTTAKILDGTIASAKTADTVIIRDTITIIQDGTASTGAAGYMPFDGDIVAVGFFNDNGTGAFTTGANVAVTGGAVATSNATLALLATEHNTTLTNNTGLSKGDKITLTAGTTAVATGPTVAIVEVEGMLNALG